MEDLQIENEILILLLASSHSTHACRSCAQTSSRVHSRYRRQLADLRDVLQTVLDRERRYLPPLHETENSTTAESTDQMPAVEQQAQPPEAPPQVRGGKRYERYQAFSGQVF